jgi:hypothetical protein
MEARRQEPEVRIARARPSSSRVSDDLEALFNAVGLKLWPIALVLAL